jgi:hypothetical protein
VRELRWRVLRRLRTPMGESMIDAESIIIAKASIAVTRAAVEWWRSKKPRDWTGDDQIASPTIGCETCWEDDLANAVAEFVKVGGAT